MSHLHPGIILSAGLHCAHVLSGSRDQGERNEGTTIAKTLRTGQRHVCLQTAPLRFCRVRPLSPR